MKRSLYCPFPVTPSHPRATELTARTIHWARQRGLLPDDSERTLAKIRSYSALAARCYPAAPFERLAAICDYFSWLFFFDDVCEDVSLRGVDPSGVLELLKDAYAALQGAVPAADRSRFVEALADIWQRVGDDCPDFWRRRFTRHVENYIDGCVWEAQNRRLQRVPSRSVFEAMRMHTSTMYEFWDLIEYAGGYFLPDEVVEHPHVAELRRTGNAVASFANDFYSLQKEAEHRDVHNLVLVLMEEEGIVLDAARARAATIHDAQVGHFVELERSLPSFGAELDERLKKYVEGMRIWMRANYDWSLTTPRYNEPEMAAAG